MVLADPVVPLGLVGLEARLGPERLAAPGDPEAQLLPDHPEGPVALVPPAVQQAPARLVVLAGLANLLDQEGS